MGSYKVVQYCLLCIVHVCLRSKGGMKLERHVADETSTAHLVCVPQACMLLRHLEKKWNAARQKIAGLLTVVNVQQVGWRVFCIWPTHRLGHKYSQTDVLLSHIYPVALFSSDSSTAANANACGFEWKDAAASDNISLCPKHCSRSRERVMSIQVERLLQP